ncbi:MAG: vancomycin high temperature exclusion protein [Rhodospirillaceae bacterium]
MRLRHSFAFAVGAFVLGIAALLVLGAMAREMTEAWGRAYIVDDRARLPKVDAVLVLGTSPHGFRGQERWTLSYRLDAAAGLWHGGFADRFLVSGIRIGADYDEAAIMRDELVARGVPASAIELDHKGNRTWDSVFRARTVFGKRRLIIVSQPDHLARALFLARHVGVKAWDLAARGTNYDGLYGNTIGNLASLVAYFDVIATVVP